MLGDLSRMTTPGTMFGALGGSDYEALRKAVDSGYDVGGASQTGGGAWRLEFLENTLAVMTQQMRHITFYNDVPKPPARSTAIEYARRTGLGDTQGGWNRSGELPKSHDATYDRQVALIKFLGDVREIAMPFLLVDTLVDQRAETTEAGTLWLLSQLERALFKGNAKLGLNGAEFVEIDGMETYISRDAATDNTVNLWGDPLEEGHIRNAGQVVIGSRGMATHLYAPSEILEDYAQAYLKTQNLIMPTQAGGLSMGYNITELRTVGGNYLLRPLFLYGGLTRETPPTSAPTEAPAPAPGTAIALQATGTGEWARALNLTAGTAGLVEVVVSYGNQYGECVPAASVPASLAMPFANRTNSVRITLTNPVFTSAPTYISVYCRFTDADGNVTDWGCVRRLSLVSAVAGAVQIIDIDGDDIPGTYRSFLGELSANVLHCSMLLPFTRIPLPPLSLSERFALVMFPSLICRIPNRWVMFKNIGRRTV